jgi:hypothetical protein
MPIYGNALEKCRDAGLIREHDRARRQPEVEILDREEIARYRKKINLFITMPAG